MVVYSLYYAALQYAGEPGGNAAWADAPATLHPILDEIYTLYHESSIQYTNSYQRMT